MKKNRVLAVDDEVHIAHLVKINLERAGYEVRTAGDGEEALDLITQEVPDLVILDVMMPRMSGFDVLRKLKSDAGTRDIPIMMLTARGSDTDSSDALLLGVDVYLTKPFSPTELLAFVSRILPLE